MSVHPLNKTKWTQCLLRHHAHVHSGNPGFPSPVIQPRMLSHLETFYWVRKGAQDPLELGGGSVHLWCDIVPAAFWFGGGLSKRLLFLR